MISSISTPLSDFVVLRVCLGGKGGEEKAQPYRTHHFKTLLADQSCF